MKFQGQSNNFVLGISVSLSCNRTTLDNNANIQFVFPKHLGIEYWKVAPSFIIIYHDI